MVVDLEASSPATATASSAKSGDKKESKAAAQPKKEEPVEYASLLTSAQAKIVVLNVRKLLVSDDSEVVRLALLALCSAEL